MLGITDIWLFILAGLALNVTPGPDMAYVVACSSRHGRRAGMMSALGIGAGCFVHIVGGAVGLTTLLVASASAFTAVKLAGAAYLVWIGIGLLMSRAVPTDNSQPRDRDASTSYASGSDAVIFREAFWINVLNPKVALFFLAFLPQFTVADATSPALVFFILGVIFNATGTIWNLVVALTAARVASAWRGCSIKHWLERVLGTMFVGLGVKFALLQRS